MLGLGKEIAGRDVRYVPCRPGTLLDVGCGNGEYLLRMAHLGWRVQGVEPDPTSAAMAKRHGIEVFEYRLNDIPKEAGRFDVITMSHVIEHLSDPRAEFGRLLAMLKPGGLLVVLSPNPGGSLARAFGQSWRGLEPPRHLVLPSASAYRAILAQYGVHGRVLTCLRGAAGLTQETLSIREHGLVGKRNSWALAKAIAYVALPLFFLALKDRGEEIVCIAHAPT